MLYKDADLQGIEQGCNLSIRILHKSIGQLSMIHKMPIVYNFRSWTRIRINTMSFRASHLSCLLALQCAALTVSFFFFIGIAKQLTNLYDTYPDEIVPHIAYLRKKKPGYVRKIPVVQWVNIPCTLPALVLPFVCASAHMRINPKRKTKKTWKK